MAQPQPPSWGRPALWAILVIHLAIAIGSAAYTFYISSKYSTMMADAEVVDAAYLKADAVIANETDVIRLREIASRGWHQSDKNWHLLNRSLEAFTKACVLLPVLSSATALAAWWGLRHRRHQALAE